MPIAEASFGLGVDIMDFQKSLSPTAARAWLWNSGKNLPGQNGVATPLRQEAVSDAHPPGVFPDSTMLMTPPSEGLAHKGHSILGRPSAVGEVCKASWISNEENLPRYRARPYGKSHLG